MSMLDSWTWLARPTTEAEYDAMMTSLDAHLAQQDLAPAYRCLQASRLVAMNFKLDGVPILGGGDDRGEPFGPRDLLARVFDWYTTTYGERNKIDFSLGYVVLPLRGTYWLLKIGNSYGKLQVFADRNLANGGNHMGTHGRPATHNVLTSLEGITQALADKLENAEIDKVGNAYVRGCAAMFALDEMKGHDLFGQARDDYKHSVDALDGGALHKARWDTAQCAEKVMKGLLARAGHAFPTKGPHGHDIVHLGGLIETHFGIKLPVGALKAIDCPPKVRYAEMNVSLNEAWTSHDALLDVLVRLRPIALPPGGKRLRP